METDSSNENQVHAGGNARVTQIGRVGAGVTINTAPPDADARVVVGIPPRPSVIVSRANLESMFVWPSAPGVDLRVWHGLPGFGKSVLAHQFVERSLRDNAAQAAVWFDCTDQTSLTAGLRLVARHTSPPTGTAGASWWDTASHEDLVGYWLRWVNARGTPVLVVFDGWDDPSVTVLPLIPRHAHPGGVVVVTTTSPHVAVDCGVGYVTIDRFSRQESIATLRNGRRSITDPQEVLDRLACDVLHDTPIAVGLAAAWGRRNQLCPYRELADQLEISMELLLDQPLDGYRCTITALWELTQARLSTGAIEVVDQLAYIRAPVIDLTLHQLATSGIVTELGDHGLLNTTVTPEGHLVISMHQTLAAAIRVRHSDAERQESLQGLLANTATRLGNDGSLFEVWDVADAVDTWIDHIPEPQSDDPWSEPLHRCLNRLSEYRLGGRPDLTRARHLNDRCQQLTTRPDHPDTLTTRANIAYLTGHSGNPGEALRLLNELLPDETRILGADHPDTLTTRHNIASWTRRSR
jgi:hypothetical protein